MKTTLLKNITKKDRKWWIVDASQYTIGQISVSIANALRGKDIPTYTPHVDGGAYVVVINAEKVKATGNKEEDKLYYRHSGHFGNLKEKSLGELRTKRPEEIIRLAVSGMLPKNKLRPHQLRRLIIVKGDQNPHEAQKPESLLISL